MDKRRKIVQILTTILYNPFFANLKNGRLHNGKLKSYCVPGLNCYSCPSAAGSCPLGSLQNSIGGARRGVKTYVVGMLLLFSLVFGRIICGWLCPFGLLQELLGLIPFPKKKLNVRKLSFVKYIVLAVFVVLIPLTVAIVKGIGFPAFCKFICPQGTIAGLMLVTVKETFRQKVGAIFIWKIVLLIMVLISSIIVFRPFCRILCPLGAIYGLFNKIAVIKLSKNNDKCTSCGKCEKSCPMNLKPMNECNHIDCIRCGKCVSSCPEEAIHFSVFDKEIAGRKNKKVKSNDE